MVGFHGLELIKHITQDQRCSKLVVPVAFLNNETCLDPETVVRFLESGAKEILTTVNEQRLLALTVVVTNAYIEGKKNKLAFHATKKQRKISWVGIQEDKPYTHLREEM